MEILNVRLCSRVGTPVVALESGDPLRVEIEYCSQEPVEAPIFGLTISNGEGMICYDTSTSAAGLALPVMQGKGVLTLDFERLDLMGGEYFLDVGIYKSDWSYAYDYHWHVYPIKVESKPGEKGVLKPPVRWKLNGR
jgi:lipopolysaccharide transport system ATP-binding protein